MGRILASETEEGETQRIGSIRTVLGVYKMLDLTVMAHANGSSISSGLLGGTLVEITNLYLDGVLQIQHSPPDFVPPLLAMVAEGGNWWRLMYAPTLVTEKLKGHVLVLRAGAVPVLRLQGVLGSSAAKDPPTPGADVPSRLAPQT